ncbi:LD-carboxypeptidase [Clostridium sp. D2Q-14]|uniref:S66 family peptidase n=1 Tax=Anaeromonas gelatinilytica TaxID=2683194 RepID=UPI00193C6A9F|nr:S66 peptidase family protein [Anaeromonas gelatinilytica]MBS4536702.1 LD-carboxypeptidase [Anaeromonas gelatinilytica]
MIKPRRLRKGDKIATVSLSDGNAGGKMHHRYQLGKKRLEKLYNVEVVEMPNSQKGSEYIYKHPEARAEDLMKAFEDKSINAIITNTGGEDTLRTMEYVNYNIIKDNPKIFMGYSDATVNHFMCYKAGLVSFYGPDIFALAEPGKLPNYMKEEIYDSIFNINNKKEIKQSKVWTSDKFNKLKAESFENTRKMNTEKYGYEILQGTGKVTGKLIGGCLEVLEMIKATELWPNLEEWNNKILFFETSEDSPNPYWLTCWLRNYAAIGVFDRINGIIIGKPNNEKYYNEYKKIYLQVIREEVGRDDLPILYNMNFGHTFPMCILPYGIEAEINCEYKKIVLVESGIIH